MHKFSQGDIVLVPLPFTDLTASKKRPVLILSKLEYNNITNDLIVAAITSNIDKKPYTIKFTANDMVNGVLTVGDDLKLLLRKKFDIISKPNKRGSGDGINPIRVSALQKRRCEKVWNKSNR